MSTPPTANVTATPTPTPTPANPCGVADIPSISSISSQTGLGVTTSNSAIPTVTSSTGLTQATTNVVTIPVPIVSNEETYCYVCVKGSLHDHSCSVFGLNETEVMAIIKRFDNSVKPLINGVMVAVTPMEMLNTLAQLGYKVICSCGEADISWTMQREI